MRKHLLLLLCGLLAVWNLHAQTSTGYQDNWWKTNGTVRAIVRSGNTVYIGGSFTYIGPRVPYGASISTSTGSPDMSYAQPNGTVRAAVPDGAGGWYIGGDFTQVGGQTRNRLARINADGSLHAWNPNASSSVYALVVSGSTVYAGGTFTTIGGQTRNYIAAIDTGSSAATSWDANANGLVYGLGVSSSGTVYAGGSFTTIGGQARNYIAALDASTGAATSWNPSANNQVAALAVSGSMVYVGGSFTSITAQGIAFPRGRVAALDTSASATMTNWGANANGPVTAFAVSGSTVYVGGQFTTIGGQTRGRIAALDASSGAVSGWNPAANNSVTSLLVSGSTVYAGGNFTTIGGQARNYIAALDASTGTATSWSPNTNSIVNALALNGNTIYAGGGFTSAGGYPRNRVAAIDATTGAATSWNPNANSQVVALALSGSTVYAGGAFTTIGGQTRNYIAALDTSTGAATSWNAYSNGTISALAVSGSTVYAGGGFNTIGGQSRSYIAALDTGTGTATAWDPSSSGPIYALAVGGSTLYAGGSFTAIGGQSRGRIAAWDISNGTATSWDPGASSTVYALAVSGSTVYAGGAFTTIAGQGRNYIAAIDASTGAATSWNPSANGTLFALAVSGNTVYAGGDFTTIGGQSKSRIAAMDASTGNATAWNPNASSTVNALAVSGNTVYAGGAFTTMGGNSTRQFFMALVDSTTLSSVSIAASATTVCAGTSVTFTATPANASSPTYQWTKNGTAISGETAATYTTSTLANGDNIACQMTSGGTTLTSNTVGITVNALPTATITANGSTTFCAGSSVTLTASAGTSYVWSNSETTQAITVNASGNYSVTVTDTNGCSATSATTAVTVNPLPDATVTASGATTFCSGGSVDLSVPASASSYQWYQDNTVVPGATSNTYTAAASGSYKVNVTNAGCQSTSAATVVTVNPLPTAVITASGPTTFCQGGSVTLTASGGVSYVWSTGNPNQIVTAPSFMVGSSGTYSVVVTDSNGCTNPMGATTTVTVNPLPLISIDTGSALTFCQGGSVMLTATPGTSYLWSTGETTQSINPTTSDSYSVTVTDTNNCSATSAPVTVTVNPLPTTPVIEAPIGTAFCSGSSTYLRINPPVTGHTYQWRNNGSVINGQIGSSIYARTGGNYTLTITNANGCSATSAPTTITMNPLPNATVTVSGNSTVLCAGDSVVLNAPTGAGLSYQWQNSISVPNSNPPVAYFANISGATSASYTATATSAYLVTVTDSNGCSADSRAWRVTVNPLPVVSISTSGPNPFCAGTTVALSASPAGATAYQWKLGTTTLSSTNAQQNATAAGSYTVSVTDGNGCVGTSPAFVLTTKTAPAPFNLTAGGVTTFCAGGSVTLSPNPSANLTGFPNYQWSNNGSVIPGATSASYAATASGNYTVTVSDAAGCGRTSVARPVTANPLPAAAISGQNPFCVGSSTVLSASPTATGNTYRWTRGATVLATTAQITTSTVGSYAVRVTDANGCVGNSPAFALTSTTPPAPFNLTAGGVTTFCAGGSVTLSPNPSANLAGFSNYQWSNNGSVIPGATSASYAATASGNYTVTVSDAAGCGRTSVARPVTANPLPAAAISGQNPFCVGSSTVLSAAPVAAGNIYRWTRGTTVLATTAQITTSTVGSYNVTVTDANGCVGTSPAFALTSKTPPAPFNLTAGSVTTFCEGGSVMLSPNPSANLTGFSNYQWSNNGMAISGATAVSYPATASGNYTVTVSDANGCGRTSVARPVTANPNPTANITPLGSTTIGTGGSVTLQADSAAGYTYQWYRNNLLISGAAGRNYTATNSGSYTVRATSSGCFKTSAAVVVTQTAGKESLGVTASDAVLDGFSFSAFPNPAGERVTVRTNGAVSQSATVQVMSVSGAAVKEVEMKDAQTEIDLSGVASGVYLLRYKDVEGRTGIIRLVKQ